MKSLARSFVWWPGLDKSLEQKVQTCDACQRSRNLPAVAPIQPWEWPERPWSRLHVDYAGPLLGHMFLVVVDAHSKWMEVKMSKNATSSTTITALRSIFATHGIPELLVSDNSSVFTSVEFKIFTKNNGIRHTTSAPYHPATNGLAERAVQTFKSFLKKTPDGALEDRLSKFLLNYRLTPHSTTGITPAELLLGRRPRSVLDLVRPDLSKRSARSRSTRSTTETDTQSLEFSLSVIPCTCVTCHPRKTGFPAPSLVQRVPCHLRSSYSMTEQFVDTATTFAPELVTCLHNHPPGIGLTFRIPLQYQILFYLLNLLVLFLSDKIQFYLLLNLLLVFLSDALAVSL